MAAIKLFGLEYSTCTARVRAVLEEKGVDYELIPVNLHAGEHKQPSHLSRNPFGQIPALEDGDITLFESRAITKYLARKFKDQGTDLLKDGDLKESAMVEVWVDVESQEFHPAISPIVFECLIAPRFYSRPPNEEVVTKNVEKLANVLDVYEARLSKTKYLAGDSFSLADLNHIPYAHCLMATPHKSLINSRPHVKAWWEDISSRPVSKKVTAPMSFGN